MAQLHINQLKSKGKRRLDDDSITIGRSTQNGLVLAHSSVSREHCRIEITDGVARIRDLHSRHGTKINGKSITDAELFDKDVITIGIFELVYEDTNSIREVPIDEIGISEDGDLLEENTHPPDAPDFLDSPDAADTADTVLTAERDSLTQQLREQIEMIAQLEMEEAGLKQSLDDSREEFEQQKQKTSELETKLEEDTKDHATEIQNLERTNQELDKKHQKTHKEKDNLIAKLEKISLKLETTNKKLSEAVDQISANKKELETLSAALKNSRQTSAERDRILANIRSEAQQLYGVSRQLTSIQQGLQSLETVYVETDEWAANADQSDPETYEEVVSQQAVVGAQLETAHVRRDEATAQLQHLVEQYCRNIASIPIIETAKSTQKRSLLSRFTGN